MLKRRVVRSEYGALTDSVDFVHLFYGTETVEVIGNTSRTLFVVCATRFSTRFSYSIDHKLYIEDLLSFL